MKQRLLVLIAASAFSVSTVGLADDKGPQSKPTHDYAANSSHSDMTSNGSQDLHKAMMDGMQDMHEMKMSGDPDLDFVTMMIEHHEQGIAMSKAQLNSGNDPEIKRKARKIIAMSEKDIVRLNKWKSDYRSANR